MIRILLIVTIVMGLGCKTTTQTPSAPNMTDFNQLWKDLETLEKDGLWKSAMQKMNHALFK